MLVIIVFCVGFILLFWLSLSYLKAKSNSKKKSDKVFSKPAHDPTIFLPISNPTMTDEEITSQRTYSSSSFSISTTLKSGYVDHHLYPPGIVYIKPRSKVYHRLPYCCGRHIGDSGRAMVEDIAIMAGLHRCSKCDWDTPFEDLISRLGLD